MVLKRFGEVGQAYSWQGNRFGLKPYRDSHWLYILGHFT